MEKVWLKQYQEEIPTEIPEIRYASLGQMMEEAAEKFRHHQAFTCMGRTKTYEEITSDATALGAYFLSCLKLEKGDRVAVMMPNILQYPVAIQAILRAGMVVVNINPLYTARELAHQLRDSGAKAIIIVENFAHVLEEVLGQVSIRYIITTTLGEMLGFPKANLVDFVVKYVKKMVPPFNLPNPVTFSKALSRGKKESFEPETIGHEDLAFLQYTGGTTGVSKGAMLSHGNLLANIEQAYAWIGPFIETGKENIVTALPLYHIFALTANCLTFMKLGCHNLLITNPRDIKGFVRELQKNRFSIMTGVNTLFNALLNNSEFRKINFRDLKVTLGGGMAVQKTVADKWQHVTHTPLIQAYGLTETSPAVCINPLDLPRFNGSIGVPLPSTELSIRDDENKELGFDEPGEICIKGPQVMGGYWQRPEETKKVFTPDKWLRTGDVATIDKDGFIYIVDRKKDMILVSGFNVYPNEIEEVVTSHKDILEAAAIGLPDEASGEIVKIYAVRKREGLTAEELISYCRQHLTRYKVPKIVEFRSDLPKSNVGKILRRELRNS